MIEVRGALQFKTRAALDKAIVVFDRNSAPEFFTSELWTLAGPYATIETTFECEVDLDYDLAFRSMAKSAFDGIIEFRDPKRGGITRFVKQGASWMRVPSESFGDDAAKLLATWADQIAAANKPKLGKNAAAVIVELPTEPETALLLSNGTLAIACRRQISIYSTAGDLIQTSMMPWTASMLAELPDGAILAGSGQRLARLGEADTKGPFTLGVLGIKSSIAFTYTEVAQLDGGPTIQTWKDDYLKDAFAWQGGIFVRAIDHAAHYALDGSLRWELDTGAVLVGKDEVVSFRSGQICVHDANGAIKQEIAGNPARKIDDTKAYFAGDGVVFAGGGGVAEWNRTSNQLTTTKVHSNNTSANGCLRAGAATVCWCSPIFNHDTSVAAVRDGAVVARFDPKAEVEQGVSVGEAAAVRVNGAGKSSKIFVWKDGMGDKPLILAHANKVVGIMALPNGQLASWSEDKTLRIWTV